MDRSALAATEYHEMSVASFGANVRGLGVGTSSHFLRNQCRYGCAGVSWQSLSQTGSIVATLLRRRTHSFESDDIRIMKQFVRAFGEKLVASEQPFFGYLVDRCPQDVVA